MSKDDGEQDNNAKAPKADYEVGYGKPPVAHQFKKGESGNKKGRPKGLRNFSTDFKAMLRSKVPMETPTGRKNISTQQATILRLREKALKGDGRSLDRLLGLAIQLNGGVSEDFTAEQLPAEDETILRRYQERILADHKPNGDGDEDPPSWLPETLPKEAEDSE